MIVCRTSAACGLSALLWVAGAAAQPAPDEKAASDASAALAYEPVYVPPPTPEYVPDPAEAAGPSSLRLLGFGSFDLGLPLMLDVDRDLIRPGTNLHAQGGIDLGYFGFFLHGGWRAIPVDFDRYAKAGHPEYEGEGRDPLSNLYFGFGALGQIPNDSPFLPYLSVSVDMNFWHFRETAVGCGGYYYYWYCNDYPVYKFTPGFTGRLGSAVELAQDVYLDTGLGLSMSMEGEFFVRNEVWLEPYLGVGFRR